MSEVGVGEYVASNWENIRADNEAKSNHLTPAAPKRPPLPPPCNPCLLPLEQCSLLSRRDAPITPANFRGINPIYTLLQVCAHSQCSQGPGDA